MKLRKNWIVLIATTIILTANFYNNFFGLVNQEWFDNFQLDSESLVLGKLALSENDGIFEKGGLTGRYSKIPEGKDRNLYQYEVYENQIHIEKRYFTPYSSQTGGQAIVLSFLSKISPFNNQINLNLFKLINSFLSALVFALFITWVFNFFNPFVAIIVFFLVLFSPWITVFARNIWWALWSFYLPMIFIGIYLIKNERANIYKLLLLAFIGIGLKCFFTGFEYITTTCIMMCVPVVYYSIERQVYLRPFAKKIVALTLGTIAAIIISFTVLSYQISSIKGSFNDGLEHIYYSYKKRASGSTEKLNEIYSESLATAYNRSLDSNLSDVLVTYFKKDVLDFTFLKINAKQLIISLFFLSITVLIFTRKSKKIESIQSRALVISMWFSFLAPMSWLILFKGHSYIHSAMNPIVWYMPFCIIGYILIGFCIGELFGSYNSVTKGIKKLR